MTRSRGRPATPEAVVIGRPALLVPNSAVAVEIVELLADALFHEVTDHTVETPSGSVSSRETGRAYTKPHRQPTMPDGQTAARESRTGLPQLHNLGL